jgi:hypothetical protein
MENACVDTKMFRTGGSLPRVSRPLSMSQNPLPLGGGFYCVERWYTQADPNSFMIYRIPLDGTASLEPFRNLPDQSFPPRPPGWHSLSVFQPKYHTFGEKPIYVRSSCMAKSDTGAKRLLLPSSALTNSR